MSTIQKKTKEMAKAVTGMVNEKISSGAALTHQQLNELEDKKTAYLNELKSPGKEDAYIQHLLGQVGLEVEGSYLPQISELYVPILLQGSGYDPNTRVTSFNITKWVCDPKEQNIEKLVNVYQVLANEPCAIALIFCCSVGGCTVTMAVANHGEDGQPGPLRTLEKRLRSSILGNFPGAKLTEEEKPFGVPAALAHFAPQNEAIGRTCTVAAITNLATEKSEDFISQGIEKLLDGIVPQQEEDAYTLVLLANPCHDLEQRKLRLYDLYTALSPLATQQFSKGVSTAETISAMANAGMNIGANINVTVGVPGRGVSGGANLGANYGKSFSTAAQIGGNEGITQTHTNYGIKHTLEHLEEQIKRLDQCAALGMWDFAAYAISDSPIIAKNVAHMYLSLTQGEKSYVSQSAINVWTPMNGDSQTVDALMEYLVGLQHPQFGLRPESDDKYLCYPSPISAVTCLSGSELAHALNFPQRSVSGLPVFQCVPFGRNVMQLAEQGTPGDVRLGCIYHMRRTESEPVFLDRAALTAHTFITGSTGAGKSNVIYTMLKNLCLMGQKEDANFLVIEPAKGEYKDVFGGLDNVAVYGTNPKKAAMLRLNPFAFPDDIHVLEHIDRLIEVFNACWPMYAAMPAVLKDAVEEAYVSCGWSLTRSTCAQEKLYPTFGDLLRILPQVMERSSYSADTKGDYIGALVTRVKSLTNGINGQIFCSDSDISDAQLFDENVIVDLSRVGSSETKALLMGILMIKLQEYRMANAEGANVGLRHVTVLEEAHNLLRRTSTEQSQEGSNLQGKAVEMLTNAIAEMRTYGEGFIIADQAPGLLDMAVIRNTNTKLILRLPDESDRQLVGKAAGLSDEQIPELAKLDVGVAAVFQNHWLEPVLCKVGYFDTEEVKKHHPYSAPAMEDDPVVQPYEDFICALKNRKDFPVKLEAYAQILHSWIDRLSAPAQARTMLHKYITSGKALSGEDISRLLYSVLNGPELLRPAAEGDVSDLCQKIADQQIREQLHVSLELATKIRQELCDYAIQQSVDKPLLCEKLKAFRG